MELWAEESRWLLEWKLSHLSEKPWGLGIRGGHQISGFPLITASETWPMYGLFLHSTLLLCTQAWSRPSLSYSMRSLLPLSSLFKNNATHLSSRGGLPGQRADSSPTLPGLQHLAAARRTSAQGWGSQGHTPSSLQSQCSREFWLGGVHLLGKQPMRSGVPKFPPNTLLNISGKAPFSDSAGCRSQLISLNFFPTQNLSPSNFHFLSRSPMPVNEWFLCLSGQSTCSRQEC